MKIKHTISPVKRMLFILIGLSGVVSLMFFREVSPVTIWLTLAGILPLILGLLGDNLVLTLFTTATPVAKNGLVHSARATTTFPSVPRATHDTEKRAA